MSNIDEQRDDDERTDPSVALPSERPTPRRATIPPVAARPSALPPRLSSLPPRPPPRLGPPPLPRTGSIPPSSLPRPSDPPRSEAGAAQRQQLALLTTQLEAARTSAARHEAELGALKARLDEHAARLSELAAQHEEPPEPTEPTEPIEPRLAALEERGAALTEALRRIEEPRGSGELRESTARIARLEEQVRALEEHDGEARLRMRLERLKHRLGELERRLGAVEGAQQELAASVASAGEREAAREARLSRIESLFEELAEEVRAERDALDLDGVRARLDDVEALVLSAGDGEASLKKVLNEHARTIESLRESIAPPAGDDLTRIKGIGPKYARLLRDQGATSFAAIAAFTDEDAERMAQALGVPASRIRRWIEGAADLALR